MNATYAKKVSKPLTKAEARLVLGLLQRGVKGRAQYAIACRLAGKMWHIVDPPKQKP
jgi:hypothetical protein